MGICSAISELDGGVERGTILPVYHGLFEGRWSNGKWKGMDVIRLKKKYTQSVPVCIRRRSIKKGSRTHPTPLGIVRRRPPQFYNILCHIDDFYAIEPSNFLQIFFQ